MTEWDSPNQQVVRPDASGPWEEGEGGTEQGAVAEPGALELDAMTKDQLLAEADTRGIDADATMTKAQIREALEAG